MKKVITYGTFDLFHQGHYNIIKRAKEHGDYLIVGVTSESFDIERGKLNVRDSLLKRIENVRNTGLVDEIIIEEYQGQKVNDIIKYNIDTFVIGSDWIGKFDYLKNYCDVVYLERTKNISSTQLRAEGLIYKAGIITDRIESGDMVDESKFVSGIHVESVFSEDQTLAEQFCKKYELASYETEFETFIDKLDIVYINVSLEKRVAYIEKAIEQGKYVICDSPMTLDRDALMGLFAKAQRHKVVLVEKIMMVYLRAFHQLVWMARGNLIGDIVGVKCSISKQDFECGLKTFHEMVVYALCMVLRLLGRNYQNIHCSTTEDGEGNRSYDVILMKYADALATIEVGSGVDVEDKCVIIGTKGHIIVPNDWWNTGYFEAKVDDADFLKRFSFNFEGSGFRYLLQELLIMINDKRTECTRLFYEESEALVNILNYISQRNEE